MRKHAAPLVLIAVLSGGIFANSLRSEFIWDDYQVILQNTHIHSLQSPLGYFTLHYWHTLYEEDRGLQGRAYRPIIELSFAVEYAIWGPNPIGWHLTSVLWHTVNCVLLYFFALRILKNRFGAACCALLFAAHPIHVEAIVWAKARSELLAFMLMLASVLLYLRYVDPATPTRPGAWVYVGSVAAFALALLSKASPIVMPVLMALYAWCLLPRRRLRRGLVGLLPFFGIVAWFVAVDARIPGMAPTVHLELYSYKHLLVILGTIGRYLRLFLAPVGLCLHERYPTAGSLREADPLLGVILLAALLAGIAIAFYRSRTVFVALGWLLLALAPISNVKLLPRLIGEGRAYIASLGFCLFVACLLLGVRRLRQLPWKRITPNGLAVGLCAMLVLTYSGLTVRRNMDWRTNFRLWTDTARKNPYATDAHRHLAIDYIDMGNEAQAAGDEAKARLYRQMVRYHLEQAAAVVSDYARAVTQLAGLCAERGLAEEAMQLYELVLSADPGDVTARMGLGTLYMEHGRLVEALDQFNAALRQEPGNAGAHQSIGYAYLLQGRYDEALLQFRQASELGADPASTHHALATVASRQGRHQEAVEEYAKAVEAQPDRAQSWAAMGESYEALGDVPAAVRAYRKCRDIEGPLQDYARQALDRLAPAEAAGPPRPARNAPAP